MAPRRPDVVLWGAGMVAAVHADACRELGWPVRWVASRSPERARTLAAAIGAKACTFADLAGRRRGELAIVATPPSQHVEGATALLDAGYHVVVEAPIACTLDDADRLLAAERAVRRSVLYSEHLVASPTVDALLDDVASLGRLTHLSSRALQAPPSWRTSTATEWGGGALFDLGVHPVGMVLRAAAESASGPATHLTAVITDAGTDHEHGTIKLHFVGGLVATVVVGWTPGAVPDWDLQASSAIGVLRAELYPTPSLERDGEPVRASDAAVSLVRDYGYTAQLMRFWATVRTGRPTAATSRLGRDVLEVIGAAHWSAGHGAAEVPLPFAGPRDRTPAQLLAD